MEIGDDGLSPTILKVDLIEAPQPNHGSNVPSEVEKTSKVQDNIIVVRRWPRIKEKQFLKGCRISLSALLSTKILLH